MSFIGCPELGPQAEPEVYPSNPPASVCRGAIRESPAASWAISLVWILQSVELGYTTVSRKLRLLCLV